MKFIKHNFTIILLIVSSIGMGVLALATALRLRETRSISPQNTQALTPSCLISFTLKDNTSRLAATNKSLTPTPTVTQVLTTSPSPTTPLSGVTGTLSVPTSTPSPTALSSAPSPTQTLLAQNLTPSPTPATASLTPTPTLEDSNPPQVPVSGAYLPTISILITGSALLASGLMKNNRR